MFKDKEYSQKLVKAMREYTYLPTKENEQKVLDLGWNPNVPLTEASKKYAKERQKNWFRENNNSINDILNESIKISKPFDGYDEMKTVYNILNKNKGIIEKEINKICEEIFNDIKNQIETNNFNDEDIKYFINDFKIMIDSKRSPKIKEINSYNSDIYSIQFEYYPSSFYKKNYDAILCFEQLVLEQIRKNDKLNNIGLSYSMEDYPGINVELK